MDLLKMLEVMLGAIMKEYDLSNWNIYQDKSKALVVKLRFIDNINSAK
jgi:hypothetical protein